MDEASRKLRRKAIQGLAQLTVVMGIAVFVPAGTWRYLEGWAFLFAFAGCSVVITRYLMKNDPKLLQRRVEAGPGAEKRTSQKVIQIFASVAFLSVIIAPALDHRFSWSRVPWWTVVAGDALVVLGFWIVFLVFRENSFTSAVIEVDAEQRVIDSGPYAHVRHPMYAGALLLLAGIPLALGSWWGLLTLVPFTGIIAVRLLDEERFLSKDLPGYAAYREKIRYRLIPRVW
jgi:protein-S-isoprenylcysteine O-methyltransferase Ste14